MSFILHRKSEDFDELLDGVRDWDIDLTLLQSGEFQGSILQYCVNGAVYNEGVASKNIMLQGGTPPGTVSLLFAEKQHARMKWQGKSLTGEYVMTLPGSSEFSKVIAGGCRTFSMSFSEEHLDHLAYELGVPALEALLQNEVFRCEPQYLAPIAADIMRLNGALRESPELINNFRAQELLGRELPMRIMDLISRERAVRVKASGTKRARALRLAVSFLNEASPEDMTVGALVDVTEVSQRTLQYTFLDAFGLSPKAYLTTLRLHGAYRSLKSADPARIKVADVANFWEFWHMGQFAADYRKQFGELPSDTLLKNG